MMLVYLGGAPLKEPRVQAAAAAETNPVLVIRGGGADLSLHWDRQSPQIRDGDSGELTIRNGATERNVFLSPEQLRYGAIFYPDATDQTAFRLFVIRRGSPVCELPLSARENRPPTPGSIGHS